MRRPSEEKRARRGLGARSAQGKTSKAKPSGRMTDAPRGSHVSESPELPPPVKGTPRAPRGAQGKRRTRRDNPDAKT